MTTTLRELTQKLRVTKQPSSLGTLSFVDQFGTLTRSPRQPAQAVNPQSQATTAIYNTDVESVGQVIIEGVGYPKGSRQAQAALDSYLAGLPQPTTQAVATSPTPVPDTQPTGGASLTQLIAGPPGPATRLQVGTVTMGPEGQVVISGSAPNLVIDFVLPTVQAVDTVTVSTLTVNTQGTILARPTVATSITNKHYVDQRSLVMAVAFS